MLFFFFFSSRRRHTRCLSDWSSDVCSSDLETRGLVVNLASIAGTMGTAFLPVYGAAKAAVIQFTDTLNRGEQEHGVRATAISPGFVDTPMTDWNPVAKDEMIRPEDCAEIVRLLLRLSPYARIPHVVVERVGN